MRLEGRRTTFRSSINLYVNSVPRRRVRHSLGDGGRLEAAPGFEPGVRVLQTHALPLGYAAAC